MIARRSHDRREIDSDDRAFSFGLLASQKCIMGMNLEEVRTRSHSPYTRHPVGDKGEGGH